MNLSDEELMLLEQLTYLDKYILRMEVKLL